MFPDWLTLPVVKGFGYFARNDGLARGRTAAECSPAQFEMLPVVKIRVTS